MSIDTACSSSLVALQVACQHLHFGACPVAVVPSSNVLLSAFAFLECCKARMLSPDGHCKTFDNRADGYARAEGCGAVTLKSLHACDNGDCVRVTVNGSAVVQDGRSANLTSPNGPAQEDVIASALHQAGEKPHTVEYVEAHGTGTALGDPIEVAALKAVLNADRAQSQPVTFGAVKSNIGHLEAGAGMAGLIKLVLVLQRRLITPNLHFCMLNKYVGVDGFPAIFPTTCMTFRTCHEPIVAGLSSFGFGGTNAHAILKSVSGTSQPTMHIGVLFTGQGSQYEGMGHELYEAEPVFRSLMDRCDEVLADVLPHRLLAVLYGDDESTSALIHDTRYAQPALFTLECALCELWRSKGVAPAAVLGHSVGEVAAACVAGVMSLEAGAVLIAERKSLAKSPHATAS